MVRPSRLALAVCAAALVLGLSALASPARNLSVSNTRFRMAWTSFRFAQGAVELVCPITLEGTMPTSTFTKVLALQLGLFTSARTGSCTGGSATFLSTLPWSFKYWLFEGALPNIEDILFYTPDVAVRLRDTIFGVPIECLYVGSGSTQLQIFAFEEAGGGIGSVRPPRPGTSFIGFDSGDAMCPERISTGGTGTEGTMTVMGTTVRISITLI